MRKTYNFTWEGKPIAATKLAILLKTHTGTLYNRSKFWGSERGEDLKPVPLNKQNKKPRITILWEGDKLQTLDFIADQLGISKVTLRSRIKQYGEESYFTYWPGHIPRRLRVFKGGAPKKMPIREGERTKKERKNRLASIPSPSKWETENL